MQRSSRGQLVLMLTKGAALSDCAFPRRQIESGPYKVQCLVDSHVTHIVVQAGENCIAELSWKDKLVICLGPYLTPEQDSVMELKTTEFLEEEWKIRKLGVQGGGRHIPMFDLGDNAFYTLISSLLSCYLCFR